MNCFDIAILNPDNANKASTVQITRPLTCSRVNNDRITATYGQFCDASCANVAGGGTAAPTVAPGSNPSPVSPKIPYRCGTTWVDANEKCSNPTCLADVDCTSPTAPSCYADMIRVCTPEGTMAPTPASAAGTPTASPVVNKCRAIGVWSGVSGMDQWCAESCSTLCPASHCTCDDSTQALNPTTTTYQPVCQIVESKEGDTIATIAEDNDLSSNIAGTSSISVKTILATTELYAYNFQCNTKLAPVSGATWPELPVGTKIYLTGDCQLTNACVAGTPNSAIRVSTDILVCLITIFGTVFVGVN